jgi:hypothetical protein
MGLLALGRLAAAHRDADKARELLQKARGAAEATGVTLVVNQASRELADLEASNGDKASALAALRHIAQNFTDSGNTSEQTQTALSIATHLVSLNLLAPAAVAVVTLERTELRGIDAYVGLVDEIRARLDPAALAEARHTGEALKPSDLLKHLMGVIDELTSD